MQMLSSGDHLHEVSTPIFLGKNKKNIVNLSSADFDMGSIKVN